MGKGGNEILPLLQVVLQGVDLVLHGGSHLVKAAAQPGNFVAAGQGGAPVVGAGGDFPADPVQPLQRPDHPAAEQQYQQRGHHQRQALTQQGVPQPQGTICKKAGKTLRADKGQTLFGENQQSAAKQIAGAVRAGDDAALQGAVVRHIPGQFALGQGGGHGGRQRLSLFIVDGQQCGAALPGHSAQIAPGAAAQGCFGVGAQTVLEVLGFPLPFRLRGPAQVCECAVKLALLRPDGAQAQHQSQYAQQRQRQFVAEFHGVFSSFSKRYPTRNSVQISFFQPSFLRSRVMHRSSGRVSSPPSSPHSRS